MGLLLVVVADELPQRFLEVSPAEEDDLAEALELDGEDEALSKGVEGGRRRTWQPL